MINIPVLRKEGTKEKVKNDAIWQRTLAKSYNKVCKSENNVQACCEVGKDRCWKFCCCTCTWEFYNRLNN